MKHQDKQSKWIKIHTKILSVAFIVCVLIKRVSAWALELVLCREHLIGSAAIVARSRNNGQKSVGDGCKHVIALWKISSVTRGSNLHLTCSKFSMDKWRSWPTINTGWDRGSVVRRVLLMLITVLLLMLIEASSLWTPESWTMWTTQMHPINQFSYTVFAFYTLCVVCSSVHLCRYTYTGLSVWVCRLNQEYWCHGKREDEKKKTGENIIRKKKIPNKENVQCWCMIIAKIWIKKTTQHFSHLQQFRWPNSNMRMYAHIMCDTYRLIENILQSYFRFLLLEINNYEQQQR